MATTSFPRVPIVKGFPLLSESAGILTSRTLTRLLSMTGFVSCRGAARRKNRMNVELNMSGIVQGPLMFRKIDPTAAFASGFILNCRIRLTQTCADLSICPSNRTPFQW